MTWQSSFCTALLLFVVSPSPMSLHSEFIFTSAPFASCHASSIVQLRDGDLMAAWFAGSGEGHSDVAIWGSHRIRGAWSAPAELVRVPGTPTWNPVLFHSADHRLWLYYKFGKGPRTWKAARMWSDDEGQHWSRPEPLPEGLLGPIRAKPLVLEDGVIVSGSSVETASSWTVWIERSSDNGKSWTKIGPIRVSEKAGLSSARPYLADDPFGIIQPAIVSLGGKHLRFYARSSAQIRKICIADSCDDGRTWTQARPIDVPNPNSGIDAVVVPNRGVVLVFNNSDSDRTPLNLALSKDGEHFHVFATLEDEPGEYSYPAMIEGDDGALHITYTWKRQRIRYVRFPVDEISGN